MMSIKSRASIVIISWLICVPCFSWAQLEVLPYKTTPAHKWEAGIHTGHLFSAGDIPFDPGYGFGMHLRRALDYVFSFRLDGQYGLMSGKRFNQNDEFQTEWMSLSAHGIVSLNNLKWDEPNRRTNIYIYLGGGFNGISVDYTPEFGGTTKNIRNAASSVLDIGIGFAIRLNERTNIGVDHKFSTLFSKYADLVDGFDNQGFRDMANYTSVRLNYNIGKKDKAEPLYWVNPLGAIIKDIDYVKTRQNEAEKDSDEDGVLDILDLEPNTPLGAPVDTRGVTLDSDKDGIPNYQDKEPYSPPNFEYDENGVAIRPKYVTEEELNDKLREQQEMFQLFLPVVHFRTNQYELKDSELKKLSHIARMLRLYEDINLMVIGYTDQKGNEEYNNELSYNRANAVIQYLVSEFGIERSRLKLNWKGEKEGIVSDEEDSYMNRRVEFEVTSAQTKDMEKPAKGKKNRGF
ncbi:MAG: OmpA family protein [Bacteroidota bacterium]